MCRIKCPDAWTKGCLYILPVVSQETSGLFILETRYWTRWPLAGPLSYPYVKLIYISKGLIFWLSCTNLGNARNLYDNSQYFPDSCPKPQICNIYCNILLRDEVDGNEKVQLRAPISFYYRYTFTVLETLRSDGITLFLHSIHCIFAKRNKIKV